MSYLARDFDTIVDEVLKRIKTKYGDVYTDYAASSIGMMLVDVVAYVAEGVAFYTDQRARQTYFETATEYDTVTMLARQMGYYARAAVPASTDLTIQLSEAYDFPVTYSVGHQFVSAGGYVFEATEALTIDASDITEHTIAVREGVTRTVTATSTGATDQTIQLGITTGKYLVKDSITCIVDGVTWDAVDALSFEEANQYEVLYHENPPFIRFGNGISGNIPTTGSEIRITFVEGSGKSGNVNQITSEVVQLTYAGIPIASTITCPTRASGGADPESIEEIQAKAPGYAATRGVAVTREDYFSLATAYSSAQYGAVAVAQAYVARSASGDLETNNQIADAEGLFASYVSDTTTDLASITDCLDTIEADCTTIASKVSLANANVTTATESKTDVENAVYAVEGQLVTLQNCSTDIDSYLAAEDAGIVTIPELIAFMEASSDSTIVNLASDVADLQTLLTRVASQIETVTASLTSSVSSAKTGLSEIATELVALTTNLTDISTQRSDIVSQTTTAKALSEALPVTIAGYETDMQAAFTALREHLDEVLDADGLSNLITVPILAIDSEGYYAAPSSGLIRSLESYLSEKKDVAHLIKVVSGADSMKEIDFSIQIKPMTGYVYSELATQVDTLIRTLMKRREFGVDLYLSHVYAEVQKVTGIEVYNVAISSSVLILDSAGNAIVTDAQVLVLGTLTISQLS